MYDHVIQFVRDIYSTKEFIPLHEPRFIGNEKQYALDTIDSTFVSSVGKYVDQFEEAIADYVGSKFAVATVNGTAALHLALHLAGVDRNHEVITQPLTFVATCNAVSYCGAQPVFIDIDKYTLGLSPDALEDFLANEAEVKADQCFNQRTGKVIKACVPMHTFGHSVEIGRIRTLCEEYHIKLIEDAAESLGSFYKGQHTGTFGEMGCFSFNGNKIITAGGGGMLVTDNELLAKRAKHLSTTAKISHQWEYVHDEIGFNYRMPNINAAIGLAQLESLPNFLKEKRQLAARYKDFFDGCQDLIFVDQPSECQSNCWLNSVMLPNREARDHFLEVTNEVSVMTRPVWMPMHKLYLHGSNQMHFVNAEDVAARLVNIPSSCPIQNLPPFINDNKKANSYEYR